MFFGHFEFHVGILSNFKASMLFTTSLRPVVKLSGATMKASRSGVSFHNDVIQIRHPPFLLSLAWPV